MACVFAVYLVVVYAWALVCGEPTEPGSTERQVCSTAVGDLGVAHLLIPAIAAVVVSLTSRTTEVRLLIVTAVLSVAGLALLIPLA